MILLSKVQQNQERSLETRVIPLRSCRQVADEMWSHPEMGLVVSVKDAPLMEGDDVVCMGGG